MVIKKKVCAGCNELTYIYKNIEGKKYCKSCAYKLNPPKQIKKMSEKQIFRLKIKKELLDEDKRFYSEVWAERFFVENKNIPNTYTSHVTPKCECCGERLPFEPNLMYFHHILEKRNYPQYRHFKDNIAIVCPDCHNRYETNPNNVPYLQLKKEILLQNYLNK